VKKQKKEGGRRPGTVQAKKKSEVTEGERPTQKSAKLLRRTSKAKRDRGPGYTVKAKILES